VGIGPRGKSFACCELLAQLCCEGNRLGGKQIKPTRTIPRQSRIHEEVGNYCVSKYLTDGRQQRTGTAMSNQNKRTIRWERCQFVSNTVYMLVPIGGRNDLRIDQRWDNCIDLLIA
jgi:hypothetical protein